MLYWAEGSRNRNKIVFTNSDPAMARFFVEFIREYETTTNEYGLARHRAIFAAFSGSKREYTQQAGETGDVAT